MRHESELLKQYTNWSEIDTNEKQLVSDLALIGILETGLDLKKKATMVKVNDNYKQTFTKKRFRIGDMLLLIGKWFLHIL